MINGNRSDMEAALAGITPDAERKHVLRMMAKAGAHVFLLEPESKEPAKDLRSDAMRRIDAKTGIRGEGIFLATDKWARLEKYWDAAVKHYGAEPNYGVSVGPSGLVVIDGDTPEQMAGIYAAAGQELLPTVRTPGSVKGNHHGGGHFYIVNDTTADLSAAGEFKLPGGAVVSMSSRYLVGPGSHRAEGYYEVVGPVLYLSEQTWLQEAITTALADREQEVVVRQAKAAERAERRESGADEGTVTATVSAWNDATPWADILTHYGWTPAPGVRDSGCGCPVWTAPGDHDSPKSATAHEGDCVNPRVELEGRSGPVMIWTSSRPVELEGRDRWTKAQFVAAMSHRGDFAAFLGAYGLVNDTQAASMALELDAETEEAFWGSYDALGDIRTYARVHRSSPWGTLGAALTLVAAMVPPYVVLPALTGGRGSLNYFVGLVARSGRGKGTSTRTAYGVLDGLPSIPSNELGSGEGLVKAYGYRKPNRLDLRTYKVSDRYLGDVPEVDSLYSVSGRNGATMSAVLRKGWSGESLGFQYADATKASSIPLLSYRLALLVGVQPHRAGGLLGEHGGGLPQRFVFLPTNDPGFTSADREALVTEVGEEPPRVSLEHIARTWPTVDPFAFDAAAEAEGERQEMEVWAPLTAREFVELKVGPLATAAVDADADSRLAEEIDADVDEADELAGHRTLLRLKTAALLSILVGVGGDVTDEMWNLAGVVLTKSDETVGRIRAVLRKEARRESENKGRAMASLELARDAAKGKAVADIRQEVSEKMAAALVSGEEIPKRDLRAGFKYGPRREMFDALLAEWLEEGLVEERNEGQRVYVRRATETAS